MSKVEKDGIVMVARDKNQLAAFLNNGWKKIADEKTADEQTEVPGDEPEEHEESAGEPPTDDHIAEAESPKRGRKPAQK